MSALWWLKKKEQVISITTKQYCRNQGLAQLSTLPSFLSFYPSLMTN